MPRARRNHHAVVYNNEIWLIGGMCGDACDEVIDVYNPLTASYRQASINLPIPLHSFACHLVDASWLLLIGGQSSASLDPIDHIWAIDLSLETKIHNNHQIPCDDHLNVPVNATQKTTVDGDFPPPPQWYQVSSLPAPLRSLQATIYPSQYQ
jgi:hypothetical protein